MKVLIWKAQRATCDCDGRKMDAIMINPELASLYPHTWCYDPFLLACFPGAPEITEAGRGEFEKEIPSVGLVIVPHDDPDIPWEPIRRHIGAGKAAILVNPNLGMLAGISPFDTIEARGRLLSSKEHWIFQCSGGREYQYPQSLWFERYVLRAGGKAAALAAIGDWPDVILTGNVAVFASDFVHAYELYRLAPREFASGGFTDAATLSFVQAARFVLGARHEGELLDVAGSCFDLRRDFHSYGYARKMVQDLSMEFSQSVDLAKADECAWEAVTVAVAGAREAKTGKEAVAGILHKAFQELERAVQAITPLPVYLVDSHHGGILFGKYGFAEYDYPTLAHEWISAYLGFADALNYRFCLEFSSVTHENARQRHPLFYERLKRYCGEGKVEIVNGTYGQPYPQFFPLESNILQFTYGQQILKEIFGSPATAYVSQEFGFTPQHPGILSGHGYTHVCHRAQNFGSTPVELAERILWEGTDGSTIPALPSNAERSEADPIFFFMHLPRFIAATARTGQAFGVYVNMLDLFWMPPFREEHIRATAYAPVLGTYHTFSGLQRAAGATHAGGDVRKAYALDDYEFTVFSGYRAGGSIASILARVHSAEPLLESVEKLGALASVVIGRECAPLDGAWKALAAYECHDDIAVPDSPVGGHTRIFAGEIGPNRAITVEEAAWQDLKRELDLASDEMETTLGEIVRGIKIDEPSKGAALLLFNPCSFARTAFIRRLGTSIKVPSLGYVAIPSGVNDAERTVRTVTGRQGTVISNGILKVKIERDTGAVGEISDAFDGKRTIAGRSNELVYGTASTMKCNALEMREERGRKTAVAEGKVLGAAGELIAYYQSVIALQQGERRVLFETTIHPAAIEEGDQWVNSVRARFRPAMAPLLTNRMYMNVVERVRSEKFVSLYLVDAFSRADGPHVFLHNTGSPHYIRHADGIDNVLVHAREKARTFRYCFETAEGNSVPMRSALDYQMPVHVRHVPSFTDAKGSLPSSFSLLEASPDNVIVTRIRAAGHSLRLRIVECNGQGGPAVLKCGFTLQEAYRTDYYGTRVHAIAMKGRTNEIPLEMSPFQISNLELVLPADIVDRAQD